MAVAVEAADDRPLCVHARRRRLIVQRLQNLLATVITSPALQCQSSLPRRWEHVTRLNWRHEGWIKQPAALQARHRQDDRLVLAFAQFADARIDVAANHL